MSESKAPLGFGLYFIDVLACMLFSITLALAGARFDQVEHVSVQLPPMERSEASLDAAPELAAQSITLRQEEGNMQIYLGEDPVTLDTLTRRLESAPPPAVVLRSEQSLLAQVIAVAHSAGVHDVQVAYESVPAQPGEPAEGAAGNQP
jgi:biopolymer transport protein ExbD